MTIATSIPCTHRQPAGIDRLAQRLGLALVAWGERPKQRPEKTRADLHNRRIAAQLIAAQDDAKATRAMRFF